MLRSRIRTTANNVLPCCASVESREGLIRVDICKLRVENAVRHDYGRDQSPNRIISNVARYNVRLEIHEIFACFGFWPTDKTIPFSFGFAHGFDRSVSPAVSDGRKYFVRRAFIIIRIAYCEHAAHTAIGANTVHYCVSFRFYLFHSRIRTIRTRLVSFPPHVYTGRCFCGKTFHLMRQNIDYIAFRVTATNTSIYIQSVIFASRFDNSRAAVIYMILESYLAICRIRTILTSFVFVPSHRRTSRSGSRILNRFVIFFCEYLVLNVGTVSALIHLKPRIRAWRHYYRFPVVIVMTRRRKKFVVDVPTFFTLALVVSERRARLFESRLPIAVNMIATRYDHSEIYRQIVDVNDYKFELCV